MGVASSFDAEGAFAEGVVVVVATVGWGVDRDGVPTLLGAIIPGVIPREAAAATTTAEEADADDVKVGGVNFNISIIAGTNTDTLLLSNFAGYS